MSDWNEIRRPFREALISGFNWNSLAVVLRYHGPRRLDRITSENEGFDANVDDVIDDAVRNGWLEKLAEGALEENPLYTGLIDTVPHIVDGVAAEGTAYYQGSVFEVSQRDPARQESDTHKPGASSTDQPIIYQVSGDLVYGNKTEGDDISVGSITNSEGIAIGRGSSASVGERKSEAVDSKSSGGQEPDVRQLQRQIADQFNLEELQDLCFTLEVDFENLGGTGKSAKARELVLYMQRRGQLDRLVEAIQELR